MTTKVTTLSIVSLSHAFGNTLEHSLQHSHPVGKRSGAAFEHLAVLHAEEITAKNGRKLHSLLLWA